jgi:serine/threonine-protein kinase RsbW
MDWLVDTRVPGATQGLQDILMSRLRRRAMVPADLAGTARLVDDALAPTAGPMLLVRLDWERAQPVLRARSAPEDLLNPVGSVLAEGIWAPDEATADLDGRLNGQPGIEVTLPVSRTAEVDLDLPGVDVPVADPRDFPGTVAAVMTTEFAGGASLDEAGVTAGATGAANAWRLNAEQGEGREPATAAEAAEVFTRFYNAAGADFFVVEADRRRAVMSNRRCPFGPGVMDRSELCRCTSALLGSIAARVGGGKAVVTLDEAIAEGESRCRAVIDLDGEPTRFNHHYLWPAPGPRAPHAPGPAKGFRVAVSLQLPRDHLSVPLIRHMVSHALQEVGVVEDDVGDVTLAVTEAAANVIKHSGRGDAYNVEVTIGPELAELRVIDVGHGFDSEAIKQASPDDESGRGIALLYALVDQARLTSVPERGTVVHLTKRLQFNEDAPARRLMLARLAEGDGETSELEYSDLYDPDVDSTPGEGDRTG